MVGLMFSYRAFITRNIMFEDHSLASSLPRSSRTRTSHAAYLEMTESVSPFPEKLALILSSIADAVVNTVRLPASTKAFARAAAE